MTPAFNAKTQLGDFLYQARILDRIHAGAESSLIVFNYHRIREHLGCTTPFHDAVFGPTVSEFEEQIAWLSRHTNVISEATLIEALQSNCPLPGRCSMITFDDGYRDNFTLAFPILEKYGVSATFFIPSGMIESRQLGWWDIVSYLLGKTSKNLIHLDGLVYQVGEARQAVARAILSRMKHEPYERTCDLPARLSVACEVDFPTVESQSAELMTWEEIRHVSRSVVTIGSHTHTHPVLATMNRLDQTYELTVSKAFLERQIGKPVHSIAYPVGGYSHFTQETKELARDSGYALGYSFATGVNTTRIRDRFDLKRVSSPLSAGFFAAKACFPRVFASA